MSDLRVGNIDSNAGICIIQITYNPVDGVVKLHTRNIPNQLIALGMLEAAKSQFVNAMQQAANRKIAVPGGPLGV